MNIFKKLFCLHRWEIHFDNEILGESWEGKKAITERHRTLICKECGAIKKIIL